MFDRVRTGVLDATVSPQRGLPRSVRIAAFCGPAASLAVAATLWFDGGAVLARNVDALLRMEAPAAEPSAQDHVWRLPSERGVYSPIRFGLFDGTVPGNGKPRELARSNILRSPSAPSPRSGCSWRNAPKVSAVQTPRHRTS